MAPDKEVFQPLLVPGFHPMALKALRALCVDSFPGSKRRPQLCCDLEDLVADLEKADIAGELWVDGSFLTEKPEPNDIDVLLRVSHVLYDEGSKKQRDELDLFSEGVTASDSCDCYLWLEYSPGHTHYQVSEQTREKWTKQFGFDTRTESFRGIAVVTIPGVIS